MPREEIPAPSFPRLSARSNCPIRAIPSVDTILTMASPTVIGRYQIVAVLGSGAMGSVYKAQDPAVGRVVALKTIHSAALGGEHADEYRARFYREARASGVLAHPSIVPVFDVGEHDGAPFLVMEYVEGRTLADALRHGDRFTIDRVCEIGRQLAEALAYAHRQGVIHRDIKPANILLTSREVYGSERPRITDFGIAKLVASEITTTGQLLGTPSFMPPEQFTGAPVDGRADLFSLGVILYAMAAGEQPFPGETMTAVSYKVVHTEPIPPSRLNPGIAPGLENVILKCLAKNPALRYQTGDALAQDLATLQADPNATGLLAMAPLAVDPNATLAPGAGGSAAPPPQTTVSTRNLSGHPAASRKNSRRGALAAAAVLLVAATAGGGWFLYRLHNRQSDSTLQQVAVSPVPQSVQPMQPAPAQASTPAPAVKPEPQTPASKTSKNNPHPHSEPQTASAKPAPQPAPPPAPAAPAKPSPTPAPVPHSAAPPAPAAPAVDPHKLDPNTNSRFKIDSSHLPGGLYVTVEMNHSTYLSFVSGGRTDLENLFVPPGIQTFHVYIQNGSQKVVSNIVSSEFKAKKKKSLKIELRNQGKVAPASPTPLSSGAQVFVSLSTPFFF